VRRRAPRTLGTALADLSATLAPATTLATVQACWVHAVGDVIAAEAAPVSEREGVVTVECRSAVWAQELDLLSGDLVTRLNDLVASGSESRPVRALRVLVGSVRGV
jgi:predicted nucleic acid-binding Zn ribbon protein